MAKVRLARKWGIPYGVKVYFNHREACKITDPNLANANAVAAEIISSLTGYWWISIIAAAIYIQIREMRKKNENSGGRGIGIKFHFLTGTITRIWKRCSTYPFFPWQHRCGKSPCS